MDFICNLHFIYFLTLIAVLFIVMVLYIHLPHLSTMLMSLDFKISEYNFFLSSTDSVLFNLHLEMLHM